jgi:hypothetical protein
MATERAANLARERYSSDLHNLGAHAIAVDQVQRRGEKTFAVVAFFEEKPDKIPNKLKVKIGNRTWEVPLVARIFEKFKPE